MKLQKNGGKRSNMKKQIKRSHRLMANYGQALADRCTSNNRLSSLFYVECAESPVRMETAKACLAALGKVEDIELAYHQNPVATSEGTITPRPA